MIVDNYAMSGLLGIIPKSWRRYNIPADLVVIQWVVDFSERVKQLQKVVNAASLGVSELKVVYLLLVILL